MNTYVTARIGSLIARGGIIWAVYTATREVEMGPSFLEQTLRNVFMQSGPLEICAAGILVWIFAKWRASVAH